MKIKYNERVLEIELAISLLAEVCLIIDKRNMVTLFYFLSLLLIVTQLFIVGGAYAFDVSNKVTYFT